MQLHNQGLQSMKHTQAPDSTRGENQARSALRAQAAPRKPLLLRAPEQRVILILMPVRLPGVACGGFLGFAWGRVRVGVALHRGLSILGQKVHRWRC